MTEPTAIMPTESAPQSGGPNLRRPPTARLVELEQVLMEAVERELPTERQVEIKRILAEASQSGPELAPPDTPATVPIEPVPLKVLPIDDGHTAEKVPREYQITHYSGSWWPWSVKREDYWASVGVVKRADFLAAVSDEAWKGEDACYVSKGPLYVSLGQVYQAVEARLQQADDPKYKARLLFQVAELIRSSYVMFEKQVLVQREGYTPEDADRLVKSKYNDLRRFSGLPVGKSLLPAVVAQTAALAVFFNDEQFLHIAQEHAFGLPPGPRNRSALAAFLRPYFVTARWPELTDGERKTTERKISERERAIITANDPYLYVASSVREKVEIRHFRKPRLDTAVQLQWDDGTVISALERMALSPAEVACDIDWEEIARQLDARTAGELLRAVQCGLSKKELGEKDYRHLLRQLPRVRWFALQQQTRKKLEGLKIPPHKTGWWPIPTFFKESPNCWVHTYEGPELRAYNEIAVSSLPYREPAGLAEPVPPEPMDYNRLEAFRREWLQLIRAGYVEIDPKQALQLVADHHIPLPSLMRRSIILNAS